MEALHEPAPTGQGAGGWHGGLRFGDLGIPSGPGDDRGCGGFPDRQGPQRSSHFIDQHPPNKGGRIVLGDP